MKVSKSELAPVESSPGLDHVSLLNEVIRARKEEASQLKSLLETTRARITSERSQWSQQKNDEEDRLRNQAAEMEQSYQQRLVQIDEDVRQSGIALQNQRALESAAEQRVIEANERLAELDVLADERVEIQLLKKQIELRAQGLEEREANASGLFAKGQDALSRADQLEAACQARTLRLNDREAELQQRDDAVLLREHQVEKVEQELDRRLVEWQRVQEDAHAGDLGISTGIETGVGAVEAAQGESLGTDLGSGETPQIAQAGNRIRWESPAAGGQGSVETDPEERGAGGPATSAATAGGGSA